jgi:hypothetical protein
MQTCPHCGQQVLATKHFCHHCGKAISPAEPATVTPAQADSPSSPATDGPLFTGNAVGDRWAGGAFAVGTLVLSSGAVSLVALIPYQGLPATISLLLFCLPPILIYRKLKQRYPVVANSYRITALILYVLLPVITLLGAFALCLVLLGQAGR